MTRHNCSSLPDVSGLEKFAPIVLYKGATTTLNVDLTQWDLRLGTCLITIKNLATGKLFKEIPLTEAKVHEVTITSAETAHLIMGNEYGYDIMLVTADGERYAQCLISNVIVKKVVGSNE